MSVLNNSLAKNLDWLGKKINILDDWMPNGQACYICANLLFKERHRENMVDWSQFGQDKLISPFTNMIKYLECPIEFDGEFQIMPMSEWSLSIRLKLERNPITHRELMLSSLLVNILFCSSFTQMLLKGSINLNFVFDELVTRLICRVNMLIHSEMRWLIAVEILKWCHLEGRIIISVVIPFIHW